jgi:hypothetical protein
VTFKRDEILHVRVTTPALVGMVICPVRLVSYQSLFLEWDFLALIISLLPNLGVRLTHILAVIAIVFISLYIFIVRGWGDYLVRTTQMAVIGFIFPNSSAVVKEF